MSNPIASLKKSRKPPLLLPDMMRTSPVPQRLANDLTQPRKSYSRLSNKSDSDAANLSPFHNSNANVPERPLIGRIVHDSSRQIMPIRAVNKESELIDEVTNRMAEKSFRQNSLNASSSLASNGPTDLDLMQIMMKKLKFYEAKCHSHENQLKEKEKRIRILEEKNGLYERAQQANTNKNEDYVSDLECKHLLMQQKVYEMEKFFADYGFTWIGESDEQTLAAQSILKDNDVNTKFKCNYDKMLENIKELNALAREGEQKIVENSHRAMFQPVANESIRLVLYENGVMLFNGPFRSFSHIKTQRFCQDIMDGYFPSELQNSFPDGIPFDVSDKREITYEDKLNRILDNKGYRLGDDTEHEETNFVDTTQPKLTIEQFLNKLPTCVIKNGNVIKIRSDIENKLKDTGDDKQDAHSTVINSEAIAGSQMISLKIKTENGKNIIISVKSSDTIREIKKVIRNQM